LFGSKVAIDEIENTEVHLDAGIITRSVHSIFEYISKVSYIL